MLDLGSNVGNDACGRSRSGSVANVLQTGGRSYSVFLDDSYTSESQSNCLATQIVEHCQEHKCSKH